jgi:hypothetical protein
MEPHSGPGVDVVDEALEELNPVLLSVVDGVISLAPKELGACLEEAAALADGLEGAVEACRSGAVTVPQEPSVLGGYSSHVDAFKISRQWLAAPVVRFDGLGHPEVLLGHRSVRNPSIGQGHAHGAVTE